MAEPTADLGLEIFEPKDPNVTLWRYSTLWKLLDTLRRRDLRLTLLDDLARKFDPFEGSIPVGQKHQELPLMIASRSRQNRNRWLERTYAQEVLPKPEDPEALIQRLRKAMLRSTHVNCWRQGGESEAMWQLYCSGTDGVAMTTTFAKLRQAVRGPTTDLYVVNYHDYYDATKPLPYYRRNFDPSLYKRKPFEHEGEVRIVRHVPEDQIKAAASDAFTPDPFVPLSWDPEALIDAIMVKPGSPVEYFETVSSAVRAISPALADKVKRSPMSGDPMY